MPTDPKLSAHQLARRALVALIDRGEEPNPDNFARYYGDGSSSSWQLLLRAIDSFDGLFLEHPKLHQALTDLRNNLRKPRTSGVKEFDPGQALRHIEANKQGWLTEIFNLRHALRLQLSDFRKSGNLVQSRLFEQMRQTGEMHALLSGVRSAGADLTPDELRRLMGIALAHNQQIAKTGEVLQTSLGNALHRVQELTDRIDELEQAAQGHANGADTDPLTGLLNRRGLERRLPPRDNGPVAVIAIDLDHFKRINDTYGHPVGDQVLVSVADTLQQSLRKRDLLARFGGEEFIVILPGTDLNAGYLIAERFRMGIARQPIRAPGGILEQVTASFGVAIWDAKHSFEQVYSEADRALYAAKAAGRNRVITTAELSDRSPRPAPKSLSLLG